MYCIKCGKKVNESDKFCTGCGAEIKNTEKYEENKVKFWPRKKSVLLLLTSIIITSIVWLAILGSSMTSTEDEAISIITNSFETIGRQRQAWDKAELIISLFSEGMSDECIYQEGCVDETISTITSLRAEIEKERSEIDGIWAKDIFNQDFDSYFSNLEERNQTKILDVFKLYFPEDSEELEETPVSLL